MKSRNNNRTGWSMKRVAQYCSVPIQRLAGDKLYLKTLFKQKMGYKLDLNNPQTFSEKLQWLKLNDRKPLYTQLVDKYEVKKYIAQKIGEEYVIPTLGVYKKFDDIDFEKLPKQFVIKCTHDSGGLVICKNKDKLDIEAARKIIQKALKRNYFWYGREWPYKNVKPRIIVEQYMEDAETHDLKDYKFFTFSGEIGCVLVDLDRFTNHTRAVYNRNWERMPFTETFPTDYNVEQKCPKNFDKMVALVEKIAETMGNPPHARIDLYTVGGGVYMSVRLLFSMGVGSQNLTRQNGMLGWGI